MSRPIDELLGHEVLVTELSEVEHRHDVRVNQRGAQLGLVDELLDGGPVAGHLGAEPLDDEEAAESLGAVQRCGVDVGHPATVDPAQQVVAAERSGLGGGRARRSHLGGGAAVLFSAAGAAAHVDGGVPVNDRHRGGRRRTGALLAAAAPPQ
jgi:hypothetical protein